MRLSVKPRPYLAYFAASVLAVLLGWIVMMAEVNAQQPADARMLPRVTVTTKANLDPVE